MTAGKKRWFISYVVQWRDAAMSLISTRYGTAVIVTDEQPVTVVRRWHKEALVKSAADPHHTNRGYCLLSFAEVGPEVEEGRWET